MKIRVTVEGRTFDVDVIDAGARPVVAVVDGERFEIWPEDVAGVAPAAPVAIVPAPAAPQNGKAAQNGHAPAAPAPAAPAAASSIVAPIPGVIVKVTVEPGARVAAGQEVCVLEAMKMQNAVRAPRDGVIAQVRVSAGQSVRHREALMEYAP